MKEISGNSVVKFSGVTGCNICDGLIELCELCESNSVFTDIFADLTEVKVKVSKLAEITQVSTGSNLEVVSMLVLSSNSLPIAKWPSLSK